MKPWLLLGMLLAAGAQAAPSQTFQWKEDGRMQRAWLDPNEVATLQKTPPAALVGRGHREGAVRFFHISPQQRKQLPASTKLLPVLRVAPDSKAEWRLPVGGVIVASSEPELLRQWVQQQRLSLQATPVPGFWLVNTAPGQAALDAATALSALDGVSTAMPNWQQPVSKR